MQQLEILVQFAENCSDLLWSVDRQCHLAFANRACREFLQTAAATPHTERWKDYYQRALDGESFEVQEDFLLLSFQPLLQDGNVQGVIGHGRALTNAERIQPEIQRILDISMDVICTINREGRFVTVGSASRQHWGYAPEEMQGRSFTDLVYAEDLSETVEIIEAILRGQEVTAFENRYVRKDGRLAYNLWSARWDAASGLIYCVARNAFEALQKEAMMRQSEQRFRALVQDGSDLVGILNRHYDYTYVSPTVTSILGFPPDEFIGKNPFSYIHPDDRDKVMASLEQLATVPKVEVAPYRFLDSKGEWRWIETVLTNMLQNPAVRGIVANSRDITARKRSEAEKDLQAQISRIFNEEKALDSSLDKLCAAIAGYLECDCAEVWMPQRHKDRFQLRAAYSAGETGPDAVIGIPLRHQDQLVGVLVIGDKGNTQQQAHRRIKLGKLENFIGSEISRKKLEQEFEQLFRVIPKLIVTLDEEGLIMRINPAGCDLLAATSEELVGQAITGFVHPHDLDTFKEEFRKLDPEGRNSGFSCRIVSKSGQTIWLNWSWNYQQHAGIIFASARNITAEKKLTELLEDATTLARIGGWELDVQTRELKWSDQVHAMHETDPATYQLDLETVLGFYHTAYRNKVTAAIHHTMQTGEPFDVEAIIVTARGRQLWVRTIGRAEIRNGVVVRLYGSFQDIDDRKRTEEELKKAYEETNQIVESISDAFFTMDKTFKVTYWNRSAERMIGVRREDLVGRNLWEAFPNAVQLPSYTNYHQVLETGQPMTFEDYYGIWLEVNANRSEEGLTVFFRDITLRKEADLRLQEAYERFEKVAEATNEAIWDWNIQTNHMYWGTGFSTLFGYTNPQVAAIEHWENRIAEDDRERVVTSLRAAIADPACDTWEEEYRYRKADGSYAEVMDRGLVIRDRKGEPLRMVGAIRDITYRKEYQRELKRLNEDLQANMEKLQDANEELEQFAFVASHDLQEPLRMVASFMDQLKRKYSDRLDDKANQYIFFAADGARRMKKIINDLLEFSRAGRYQDIAKPVDLMEILQDYRALRCKVLEEKSVQLMFEALPVVKAQKVPLMQTFHCLLDNAIKYARADVIPEVTVRVTEDGGDWIVAIRDNGIGIENQFFDKIFVIFQRLHNRDMYEGTGIGLSLVKKHVESWGGKVWLESLPGVGSTFYFTIKK